MSDALFPSNPELAEIHVEDVKTGYVVLHSALRNVSVVDEPFAYRDIHGDQMIDLPVSFTDDEEHRTVQWLTFPLGAIVTVEA